MKNNSHSPVTEMLSAKYKIWLTVGLAALFTADMVACICLWADGVPASYWLFPFIFALVDGLYMLGAIFSNQRFKYAFKMFIAYAIVTAIEIAVWIIMISAGDDVVFENASAAFWAIVHIVGLIAAVIAYLYAAKRFKFAHVAQLSIAVAAVVIAAALMLLYMISLAASGFFGQGGGLRPLIFAETDDGNGYIVTGVMDGNGDTVAVPNEFNGKKVVAVSYNVFSARGVKRVNLDCDADARFTDYADLTSDGISMDLTIYTPVEKTDVFRKTFYAEAARQLTQGVLSESSAYFTLGNLITPVVPSDEVFVTFDYDYASYTAADENVIPTWHGKKDSVFTATALDGVEYALHSDGKSDDDLYWNYNRNKYIMNELRAGDDALLNCKITSSTNVKVSFERVHKIFPGETNDSLYDVVSSFPYAIVDDEVKDYKLTVADHADDILAPFDRDGFSVRWEYSTETLSGVKFSSLNELLSSYSQSANVTISPMWILDAPTVNILSADDKTTVVYGDEYSLTAEATHTLGDVVEYEYKWFKGTQDVGGGDEWSTSSMPFDGGGEYSVAVVASAPTVTSLSSSAVKGVAVNVARRPVDVTWTDPVGAVDGHVTYNGESQTVTPDISNVVDGDSVYVNISSFSYEDAGEYECKVILAGDRADRYYIRSGDETHDLIIDPFEVDILWDNVVDGKVEFTYNGTKQAPQAHAFANWSAGSVTQLSVEVTGEQINANVGDAYTATARIIKYWNVGGGNIVDGNYKIKSGATQTFVINPLQINVVWGDNTTFEYNGDPQAPTARANGEPNETGGYKELVMTVSGAQTNVGNDYTATASHPSSNYTISQATLTQSFIITQKPITVTWSSSALAYNGGEQAPVPSATGVKGSLIDFTVTGKQTNAGLDYVATAAPTAELDRQNYLIVNPECAFSVSPREIAVVWTGYTLTYNGAAQQPNAIATGVNNRDLAVNVTVAGEHVDAATYTAAVSFVNPDDTNNYVISNPIREFTINKRSVNAVWGNLRLEYNGSARQPTATVVGVSGALSVAVSVTEAAHTDAGEYNAAVSFASAQDIQNYDITNAASAFSIYAKSVAVVWGERSFEYNGDSRAPVATANGVNGALELTVGGAQVNAGNNYIATAELKNAIDKNNYALTDASCSYSITRKSVAVVWGEKSFEYNGDSRAPVASANGVNGALELTVGGAQVNAGNNYTATAELKNATDKNNYALTDASCSYSITRKSVAVVWTNTSLEYNGSAQLPDATITGVSGNLDCTVTVTGEHTDVSGYTATVTLDNALDRRNYDPTGASTAFNITEKSATVTVNNVTVEYGETPVYSYSASGFIGADGDAITVEYNVEYVADADGNIPPDSYTITVTVTGDVASNYTVTVVPGTLIVGEKPAIPPVTDEQ